MGSYCDRAFGLAGRVVVVTGGYGDLGTAIVGSLRDMGAKVAIIGRDATRHRARTDVLALQADVRCRADIEAAFETILETFGHLTCLVNNAGLYRDNTTSDPRFLDDWAELLDVNLSGPAICSAVAAGYFGRHSYGKIVNVGSAYSTFGHHKSLGYSAAKTGVLGLTRALAAELGRKGIRANAVLPGWFDTRMNDGVPGSPRGDYITQATPLGRWGKGQDLAGVIGFLCGPASDFLTGAAISVDGGYSISDRSYEHR